MHLRFIEQADIPGVVDVACSAYLDTAFFGQLVPGRKEYPAEWRRFMVRSMTRHYLSPDTIGLVCVTDLNDDFYRYDRGEEIMGYIFYFIHVQSQDVNRNNIIKWKNLSENAAKKVNRLFFGLSSKYSDSCLRWLPWTEPAINGKAQEFIRAQESFWEPLPYYIDAADIGVSSEFQRRGVGTMMLGWGMKYIQKHDEQTGQHTPLVLHATPEGLGLYQKLGFKVLGYSPMTAPDANDKQIFFPGLMLDLHDTYIITGDDKDTQNRAVQASFRNKPSAVKDKGVVS